MPAAFSRLPDLRYLVVVVAGGAVVVCAGAPVCGVAGVAVFGAL
jgi:hypothetical protein